MGKLINNTTIKSYCLGLCCQGTPKRAVHAEGGAISINTKVKFEDTEITVSRNHRQSTELLFVPLGLQSALTDDLNQLN